MIEKVVFQENVLCSQKKNNFFCMKKRLFFVINTAYSQENVSILNIFSIRQVNVTSMLQML